jgi:hypothetical protein
MIAENKARYGAEFVEYARRTPAIVPFTWPALPTGAAKE